MNAQRVFRLSHSDGYEWLLPENNEDFDLLHFDGSARADRWSPIRMERLRFDDDEQFVPGDFPACSGGDMLFLSSAAREKLGSELEQHGELLPLACEDGDFFALNVTTMIDALDEEKSQFLRASDTGAILIIKKHVFKSSELGQARLFKLTQTVRGLIYVTDPIVDLVKASGLKGLEFEELWSPI